MCCKLNRSLPFIQQQHLCHLQPTCPYLQPEIINFPPIICLPDGEELLPYKGPCSLQLRPPEQQLELIRATVHAPPNRTIFDGDLIDIYTHSESVQTPSSNSAVNDARSRTEDPPPTYSEVMGDTACHSQHSNNAPPKDSRLGRDVSQTVFHAGSSESTTNASTDINKNSWQKQGERTETRGGPTHLTDLLLLRFWHKRTEQSTHLTWTHPHFHLIDIKATRFFTRYWKSLLRLSFLFALYFCMLTLGTWLCSCVSFSCCICRQTASQDEGCPKGQLLQMRPMNPPLWGIQLVDPLQPNISQDSLHTVADPCLFFKQT